MPSRAMDPIKTMIAEVVQQHLLTVGPGQANRDPDIDYVEVHVISPTVTMLRVKTHKQGTRNFTIRTTENI